MDLFVKSLVDVIQAASLVSEHQESHLPRKIDNIEKSIKDLGVQQGALSERQTSMQTALMELQARQDEIDKIVKELRERPNMAANLTDAGENDDMSVRSARSVRSPRSRRQVEHIGSRRDVLVDAGRAQEALARRSGSRS